MKYFKRQEPSWLSSSRNLKQQAKFLMKIYSCCILLSLFMLTGCQQDDDLMNENGLDQFDPNYTPEIKYKTIDFGDIANNGLVDKLHLSKRKTSSTESSDFVSIEETSLSIYKERIIYLEDSISKSYTFNVRDAENPARVVNLLLTQSKETGEYISYLIDYNLTNSDIDNIESGHLDLLDLSEIADLTPFEVGDLPITTNANGAPCFEQVLALGVKRCSGHGHHFPGDPKCKPKDAYYYTYITTVEVHCPPSGGIGGGPAVPVYTGGGGGPSHSNNNNGNTIPVFLSPLTPFYLSLDQDLQNWWDAHLDEAAEIGNYLAENEYDEESMAFALEVLKVLKDGGEVDFDELILIDPTFEDNDCLRDVYDKFKQGDNTISDYIKNFEPEGSVANLTLKTDDDFMSTHSQDEWNAGAVTSKPENYMITITFNSDPSLPSNITNFSSLILAVEFMHEMIHAEMYRKLLAYIQRPNIPWTREFIDGLRNDFPGLADYYTRYWLDLPPGEEPTNAQHQAMAAHYIGVMAGALKDFDDNAHSEDYYKSLAWMGLKGTVAWNTMSQIKKIEINNDINNAKAQPPCH